MNRGGEQILSGQGYIPMILHVDGDNFFEQVGQTAKIVNFRVEEDVAALNPHRPGRAQLTHPVPLVTGSLRDQTPSGLSGGEEANNASPTGQRSPR